MEIPRLFKTETIEIEGNKIELRGTRPIDSEYTVPLEKARNKLISMSIKINQIVQDKNEDKDYSDDDIKKLNDLNNQVVELRPELNELQHKIAQRGLKRFYFPEVKDTEEIDKIEDIPVDSDTAILIANTMMELDSKTITPPTGEDLKKPRKRQPKKSSKTSGKQ
jgi:hypothetical protein